MRLKKGALVVIEGLDSTGKSTMARAAFGVLNAPLSLIHSPSGGGSIGDKIYQLTELDRSMQGLTRQFLHLAAHVEMYHHSVVPDLEIGGVIMDRNWCSTYAYGVAGGISMSRDSWYSFVQLPAGNIRPDLVVLCLEPHADDDHNTPELEAAYLDLKRRLEADGILVRTMPRLSQKQQQIALLQMLQDAGLTRS